MIEATNAGSAPIYLDFNATTPVATEVLAAMAPFWQTDFYNPSAPYPAAHRARQAVDDARVAVAHLLNVPSETIVFTSGGTESDNWVMWATWFARQLRRRRIIISAIEHPAVVASAKALVAWGAELVTIPVDAEGVIRLEALDAVLTEETALVSIMLANNEIGTIQPVAEVSKRAHAVGAWVHTDAAQAVGKIGVDASQLGVDFLTVAGHKLYAPKGIGALYIAPSVNLPPLLAGGGQEQGYRSGTESVPLVVGLGRAAQLAEAWLASGGVISQAKLRDHLEQKLREIHPQVRVFGCHAPRLPNTLAFACPDWTGSSLLARCPGILAGTGSACHTGQAGSPTLQAMGVPASVAQGLIRLSLGRETTMDEVHTAAALLAHALTSSAVPPIVKE
ncbi:MAG: cysteine desulfurase NifS [Sulfobacillus acidophilus]|uniref:cysteine desulfurase n=1 Tax=Sulfobacillus acidophilus TaxID=53633 RepID=A0A2T2WEE5_9FIRM|nr:MAG: cysteine desulfurase NifS [Sulfobacillus acidophilus]